jgi:hypothetical protein
MPRIIDSRMLAALALCAQLGSGQAWAVGTIVPTVAIDTTQNPSLLNAEYSIVITVSGTAGAPAGSVMLYNEAGVPRPNCANVASQGGVFVCPAIGSALGSAQYWARFSGDDNYASADSPIATHDVVAQYPTTLYAGIDGVIGAVGEPFNFEVSLRPEPYYAHFQLPVTGTVTITTEAGAPVPGCTGVPPQVISSTTYFKCTTTAQTIGTEHYKAVFSGDAHFAASESSLMTRITRGTTAPILTTGGNPSHGKLGQPFNLTVNLGGPSGVPTGTVDFEWPVGFGGFAQFTAIEGCKNLQLVNGTAQCPQLRDYSGRFPYRVSYWGDNTYRPAKREFSFPVGMTPQRADFNGDGRSDVFWYHTGNFAASWMRSLDEGAGLTLRPHEIVSTQTNADWRVVGIANLHAQSGSGDIIWRNAASGEVRAVVNAIGFSHMATEATLYTEPNLAWRIEQFVDLDDDGITEFIWRNATTGEVYAMGVNGTTVQSGQIVYAEPNLDWQIVASGDMNGDGKGDLLWRNAVTGDVFVMLMDGYNVIGGGVIYSEPNADWKIVGLADFNGDGNADVLWQNTATGDVFQMQMNGTSILAGQVIYGEPDMLWKIAGLGDYNGDGNADILWRSEATGQVYAMFMNGFSIQSGAFVYTEPDLAWKIVGP